MANPIDNNTRLPGAAVSGSSRSSKADSTPARSGADTSSAVGAADSRVQSERLRQVQEQIESAPEVDMERVERIKQAIAEGRYPIDARQIAAKFGELEGLLHN